MTLDVPAAALSAADDAAFLHLPSRREVARGEYAWSCRCGALLGDSSALVRHIAFETAVAVTEALDLTEETRTLDDGMAGSTWTNGIPTTIISLPNTVQRRLVTKWASR